MNILSNLDQIAGLIIRPARYAYKMVDLGNKVFSLGDRLVARHDFDVRNERGLRIRGSVYSAQEIGEVRQVLVYLHCNSGSRVEGNCFYIKGLSYLKMAIQNDFAYVVFDFTGSGLSDGKHVSLGTFLINQFIGFYQTLDL